jgi:protoheme ferro-lyase
LYDIDIEYQRLARQYGAHLERIEMLNTAPEMMRDLAGLVRATVIERGWIWSNNAIL